MGSLTEEEDQFFDTREEISSVSESGPNSPESSDSDSPAIGSLLRSFRYDIWVKNPNSISERRNKFLKWMGLNVDQTVDGIHDDICSDENKVDTDRMKYHSGAVLGPSSLDDGFSSHQSSVSDLSSDGRESSDGALDTSLVRRIKNLDDGTEFIVDELGQDGMFEMLREVGSNRLLTMSEFERRLGLTPLVQLGVQRDARVEALRKQVRVGWLKRFGAAACVVPGLAVTDSSSEDYKNYRAKIHTVKVRSCRKQRKEFSALYVGQDIKAHEGSILTMKFSTDGEYLATAGEDGIVRVWKIVESERPEIFDIHDMDPSYAYFTVNNLSEVAPLEVCKERRRESKNRRKMSDSTCVVFPQRVFRILEKPIHEFRGHCDEVLDLSWSKNKHILSSSVDKTVRLWKLGCNQCLKVFSHSDYVTCVQFNPMDDNYFISGSIDGKVRIWEVLGHQVVDWTDVHEIVTAVCHCPDGKGVIVGSMNGSCRFYNATDSRLQPYGQVSLQGKKKSPSKRITGFQFSPSDPNKLMVTSADSKVRVLRGVDVICKFRGNSGSQMSASFTSDGMHIVSASEDSHVYLWNSYSQDEARPKAKKIWSCERFVSNNASVALPWPRTMTSGSVLSSPKLPVNLSKIQFSSPANFVVGHEQCPDSFLPKGSATWPEEKLSVLVKPTMGKSQYKLLKTSCENMMASPHVWGMVIVTAGWDGQIRSFQNYGLPVRL